eukprot:TCONS_00061253-protein
MDENGLEAKFETINGSQYLFFHDRCFDPLKKEDKKVIIIKFDPKSDNVILADEFDVSLLASMDPQKPEKRLLNHPIKRFGRVVQPCHTVITPQNQIFSAIDLQSKQKLFQINDVKISVSKYALNWNLMEIGVTFQPDDPEQLDEMFFKIVNSNNSNVTLKYLAVLAVLMSYSTLELRKLNLPVTLFGYLGIEK